MANTVLKSTKYSPGTSVSAYLMGGAWPFIRNGQLPLQAAIETQTVQADSTCTFTTLATGTFYATVGVDAIDGRRICGNVVGA